MGLAAISSNYFLINPIPFVSAIKIGAFAFALNTIKGLGVLAASCDATASNVEDADYWQNQYASRVNKLTEANKKNGTEWIFPTTQEEWDHLAEINSATWSDIAICSGLSVVNSALKKGWQSDTLTKAQEAFCKRAKSYFTHYATLKGCGPNSSDLMGCVNSDPEKRKATLESLAASIETILPQNAEESKHIPIKDCYSTTNCPSLAQPKGSGAKATSSQKNPKPSFTKDCYSSGYCPDIDINNVHEREKKAAEAAYTTKELKTKREQLQSWLASNFVPPEWIDIQEVLRFRSDDPREKFLFASVEKDHNTALEPWRSAAMLSKLSQKYDLKFQVFKSHKEMCITIEEARKTGNLAFVLIHGHGNPGGIVFDADSIFVQGEERWLIHDQLSETSDFEQCFSGLQPNGKIILMSCSTGGMKNVGTPEEPRESGLPFDNLAQNIANGAKRVVVAPRNSTYAGMSDFLPDDGVLYEGVKESKTGFYSYLPFYKNLYSSFRPIFKNCFPEIDMMKIHKRELSAIDVIKTDLISKSLVHKDEPPGRANEYLQICSDDPRKKLLFYVADYDDNGAMEPKLTPAILGLFADRYDLKYKVVKTPTAICQDMDLIAKTGTIANVIILSHGTATEGMILSKDSKGKETRLKDSLSCFSKVEKNGTIFLMGSSLGQKGDDKNNIAQKIANASRRTVIAGTCLIRPAYTKVRSLDPLMMEHPKYGMWDNLVNIGCSENNDNQFKTFFPK